MLDGWMDGGGCVYDAPQNNFYLFFYFLLFATVCVSVCAVAWPEGAHSNGHPTGRNRENDETVGKAAG